MSFQIHSLPMGDFQKYFKMSAATLDAHNAQIHQVTQKPSAPCRVSLKDADVGSRVVLVNHEHQPANSPYQSRHAIYVSEGAQPALLKVNEVPESLAIRQLAVRGFDADHCIQAAEIVDGSDLQERLDALFENSEIAYAHVHYAARGCFAAKATRS